MRRLAIALGIVLASWAGEGESDADRAADLTAAKAHYVAGETAMKASDYDGAIREFGVTYELTGDPVLWWKLGRANELAGHCDTALVYYYRYADTNPGKEWFDLTAQRIKACGGEPPKPHKKRVVAQVVEKKKPKRVPIAGPHDRAAWILAGTSVALLTVGAIAAYSANVSEDDVKDLCPGCGSGLDDPMGDIPEFNAKNKAEYDALIDQGHRYEQLSWITLGLGAGCGIAAAVLLYQAHHESDDDDRGVTFAPVATPDGGGIQALVRF